jgi:hypothetical protein
VLNQWFVSALGIGVIGAVAILAMRAGYDVKVAYLAIASIAGIAGYKIRQLVKNNNKAG